MTLSEFNPFDHGTIISFSWRNFGTVFVMVTIGWFLLHLFGAFASAAQEYVSGFDAGESASLDDGGLNVSGNLML